MANIQHSSAAYFDGDKPVVAMRLLRSQEYQDLMHEAFDTHGNHRYVDANDVPHATD